MDFPKVDSSESQSGIDCTNRWRTVCLVGGVSVFLLALVFLTLSTISVFSAMSNLNKAYADKEFGTVAAPSTAFLESRLAASKLDSVSLVIDLPQKRVTLEMGGVVVYDALIDNVKSSPVIRKLDPKSLVALAREPSRIVRWESSVEKEPITILQAPATPEEAEAIAFEVPENKRYDAFFTLDLDSGIRLVFTHHEGFSFKKWLWLTRQNLNVITNSLGSVFKGEMPRYTPVISVDLSPHDALVIFRAIPENGYAVLNFTQ